jgi:glycosyltransferase involved in cell wall biosynthesis
LSETGLKKVAIIGSVGIPAKYGGFETLVEYLTQTLEGKYNITVYCSSKSYPERLAEHNGAKLKYVPLKANGFQSIPYDLWSIAKAIRKHDTLLILGVAGCFAIPFFKLFFKRKFIVHVDGTEWKRDKWGKLAKWYLKTSERLAAKRADFIIADNPVIKEYIDESYGIESVMIPYGADHVEKLELSEDNKKTYPFLRESYAFSVCRIEPENNIHSILECFHGIPETLVFVGNWLYSDYGKRLYAQYKDAKNIHLLSPIYDQHLLNEIRSNCSIYIHGHSAGGTNPSLVEAMMLGLNVAAFDVGYNRATTDEQAAYFADVEELTCLVTNNPVNNAVAMKKIALEKYTWNAICEKYEDLL